MFASPQKMHEEEEAKNPGRMRLVEMDSFTWESYSKAGEYLDLVPTIPWEQGRQSPPPSSSGRRCSCAM